MCIFFIQFPEKSLQKPFVSKMKVVFIFFNKLMRQEAAGFRMRAAYQEQGGMIRHLRFSPTSNLPIIQSEGSATVNDLINRVYR